MNDRNRYTPKTHAEPQDNSVVECRFCGAGMVQHLAVQDGWRGGVLPGVGLAWVCSKDVCRQTAREQGVVLPQ